MATKMKMTKVVPRKFRLLNKPGTLGPSDCAKPGLESHDVQRFLSGWSVQATD